jgi:hypothetical protein
MRIEVNMIDDELYQKIKKYIRDFTYLDLITWRNKLVKTGNVDNDLFDLIDYELMRRNVEIHESKSSVK